MHGGNAGLGKDKTEDSGGDARMARQQDDGDGNDERRLDDFWTMTLKRFVC